MTEKGLFPQGDSSIGFLIFVVSPLLVAAIGWLLGSLLGERE